MLSEETVGRRQYVKIDTMFSSGSKMYASSVLVFLPYLKLLQETVQSAISLRQKKSTLCTESRLFLTCFILAFIVNLKKLLFICIFTLCMGKLVQ